MLKKCTLQRWKGIHKPCTTKNVKGLQYNKLNGNQTENDRYRQNNNFLLLAKCLEMYSVFAFAFKAGKKWYYEPKKFFRERYKYEYIKRRILCWFQIRWCRLKGAQVWDFRPIFFTSINPIWVCDLRTGRQKFAILCFLRKLSVR